MFTHLHVHWLGLGDDVRDFDKEEVVKRRKWMKAWKGVVEA